MTLEVMTKSFEVGFNMDASGLSSTPSSSDEQLSATARVLGITELLQQILFHLAEVPKIKRATRMAKMAERLLFSTAETPRMKAHAHAKANVIRHLFLLQRVNRQFATIIKTSLPLRRAMFLEAAVGQHKDTKRNHCLAFGSIDSRPSHFLDGMGKDGAIVRSSPEVVYLRQNVTSPGSQYSAADRVSKIPELLEMILLQVAQADQPHAIIEVFKLQMVSRSCARAVKDSLPLRRASFLAPDLTGEGVIVANPCIMSGLRSNFLTRLHMYSLHLRTRRYNDLLVVSVAYRQGLNNHKRGLVNKSAQAARGQSWASMLVASRPCKLDISTQIRMRNGQCESMPRPRKFQLLAASKPRRKLL
nr:hypothetical protein B0A51_03077 [Rachicladosporium sp. CCFEE 5018]